MAKFLSFIRSKFAIGIEKHPKWVLSLILIPPALPAVSQALKLAAYVFKVRPIDEKLFRGSDARSVGIRPKITIDRPDVTRAVMDMFVGLKDDRKRGFGVVLGPTGTGKTHCTTEVCNGRQGVLYIEIVDPKFLGRHLAKTIGMPIGPSGLVSLALSYISETYCHYYKLPDNGIGPNATSFVLETLAERAEAYSKKYRHIPCLFIDGVDLLAKDDSDAFLRLIKMAKVYANNCILQIVFVSSEGEIMRLMEKTSSSTRATYVVEVVDVSPQDSKTFLCDQGMPKGLADKVVEHVGGRLIHLRQAIDTHRVNSTLSEEKQYEEIVKVLHARYISAALKYLVSSSVARGVVKYMLDHNGEVAPTTVHQALMNEGKCEAIWDTIDQLIKVNVLRYTCGGHLAFHSELIRRYLVKH